MKGTFATLMVLTALLWLALALGTGQDMRAPTITTTTTR